MSQHKDHPLAAQRQLADLIGKDRFAMLTRTKRQAPGFSPGSSVQAGTACCCSMY